MEAQAIVTWLTALIAIAIAIRNLIVTMTMQKDQRQEVTQLYQHVAKQTNGVWDHKNAEINRRFDEMYRELSRLMQERIAKEMGEIRLALKKPQQEE